MVGAIALCNPLTPIPLDLLRVLAKHLRSARASGDESSVSLALPLRTS